MSRPRFTPEEQIAKNRARALAWGRANKERARLKAQAWYAANKERAIERQRIYDAEHPEQKKEAQDLWNATHPEEVRAYKRAWKERNPEKVRAGSKAYAQAHPPTPEQRSAAHKRYRLKHPEKIRLKKQVAYQANKAQHNEKTKAWAAAHPERRREIARTYAKRHPDILIANTARRRARKLSAPLNDLTRAQWEKIKALYGHRCVYCGRKMKRLSQDHITPLSKGGSHTASNVVPACLPCNRKKQAGPPPVPVQPLLLTVAKAASDG